MKIAGKEISGEISIANILPAIATIISILTFVWWLSAQMQIAEDREVALANRTDDHLTSLEQRIVRIEQYQTQIANSATNAASAVAATVERNESRRDDSDRAMRAAIDRLTDRVNKLSDDLASQKHSELEPLPHLASITHIPIFEH